MHVALTMTKNKKHNSDGLINWLRRALRTKVLLGCLPQIGQLLDQPKSL